MTFQNTAIKCDTWEQMEHLARIAEGQNIRQVGFIEHDFYNRDLKYFIVLNLSFGLIYTNGIPAHGEIETTYTTFINSHPDISVEGC